MAERMATTRQVLGSALRNGLLRRIELSYGLFIGSEWAAWISLLVFAYGHGGSSTSALIALVQLVPSATLGPLIGTVADRRRPGRVLFLGFAVQGLSLGAVAAAIAAGAPLWVTFVLAPVSCIGMSVTRPALAALLPSVVRSPDELTASNVLSSWVEQASKLVVPAVAGVLLAASGPALALGVTAAMSMVAGALVVGVPGEPSPPEDRSLTATLRTNLGLSWHDPSTRLLLGFHLFYQAFVGALDLLAVILAVGVLGLGQGGAGYLNAVMAAGGLVAGVVTALLVGRTRLVGFLALGIVGATAALAAVAADPTVAVAFVLLAVVGFSGSVFDVTGLTLLQRAVPSDALAGVFALRESLMDVGLALGILVVQVGVVIGGYRVALVAPAAVAVVLVALTWRPLVAIEHRARVPQVEIRLLRSISIFRALPAPALEGVARELVELPTPAGTVVVRQGERGDRYYAVADGELRVQRDGREVATLRRGQGFGEIALVHDVPRMATVVTTSDCLLYGLDKDAFVLLLTGHPVADHEARTTADRLLDPPPP